jgi:hypothetical protein
MANEESSEGSRKTAQIKDSLSQMIQPLKIIDAEIEALLPNIDKSGQSLAFDIRDLISHVDIHHKIATRIEIVEASLEKTVKTLKVKNAEKLVGDKAGLLQDLASQYTMDSERETHLLAAGIDPDKLRPEPALIKISEAKTVELGSAEAKAGTDKKDDLGDNVELF